MGSGTQVRRREDSGRLPSLPCPSCGANLFVTCFQTGFQLLCECGRRIESQDLLDAPREELWAGLDALRTMWEDRLAALRSLSADALSQHQPQVSMVLDRHILNLAARVEILRHLHPPM
jgi:hypothetical protein